MSAHWSQECARFGGADAGLVAWYRIGDVTTHVRQFLPEHPGGLVTQHSEACANQEKHMGFGPLEGVEGL